MNPAADEPMAFSGRDLYRGCLTAWWTFVGLLLAALTVSAVVTDVVAGTRPGWGPWANTRMLVMVLPIAFAVGGVVAMVVALAASPVARLIGRALRRTPASGPHLAAYAGLGALIGLLAVVVTSVLTSSPGSVASPLLPLVMAMCAASTMSGWWRASRGARHAVRAAHGGATGSAVGA